MTAFTVRQSDLKLFQDCPLKYRYRYIDKLPREQSGALSFGTIIHDCVLHLEVQQDLDAALDRFRRFWADPTELDPELAVDYYVRGTNWKKYAEKGERMLRDWWSIIRWDSDLVLAREHTFDVPIGDGHVLHGTADKLLVRYSAKLGRGIVVISDYKTNSKVPTYDYLEEDLQFTAYAYATTRPELWETLPGGRGLALYEQYRDLPRYGEWVHLAKPERRDAGIRTERHYNRLTMAVDALARSVKAGIFVPNISGESCRWCEYRAPCGLPELMEDGSLPEAV